MKIVQYPHPTLRRISKPLRRVDKNLKSLVAEMFELMYQAKGVGLAANQVDLPFRLFIANPAAEKNSGEELVFINPVIDSPKGRSTAEEGCLSLPQLYRMVTRPEQVHISAYDLAGNPIDQTLDGMMARVVQHELDHLDGVLFIDRLDPMELKPIESLLHEFALEFAAARAGARIDDDQTIAHRLEELEKQYC